MLEAKFKLLQPVKIVDPICWYRGRHGGVVDSFPSRQGGFAYTVHVPSDTGNAVISMCIHETGLEAV